MRSKDILFLYPFLLFICSGASQTYRVHSHNDYEQDVPFWKALSAGVSSLEADVFLKEGKLMVAHEEGDIQTGRTLERLYLRPIEESLELGLVSNKPLQLLIDVKSEPNTTLDAIIMALKSYPMITGNNGISIVISGNRPKTSEYVNYPDFISFDHQGLEIIENPKVWDKVGLISLSFKDFTDWNGKGRLTKEDLQRVEDVVKKAHSLERPFRFWATPDSKTAWGAMAGLGVDYINTDNPSECVRYLNLLPQRIYQNREVSKVYLPSFEKDGADEIPKNIILMIGDGNGLAQISATALANGGSLSLTQLKNIGLLKTQSGDDFTTDSAGGATAMATGEKVRNRAIGVDMNGRKIPNLMEQLHAKGFSTAIITTDGITGATPASFFAHQRDRSMSDSILGDLATSPLDLFVASGNTGAVGKGRYFGFEMMDSLKDLNGTMKSRKGCFFPQGPAPAPLDTAVITVLENLNKNGRPFFLMVEGAQIDSYGHGNEIEGLIKEVIAFDRAVAEALRFADGHKNTLVIITADHETGGLTIPQGDMESRTIEADFTTNDHTGIFVPVFSYGPQSQGFQGVYENNRIYHKILGALGL